jgi:NAD(P)-dependent dehydrogenase (short-subunit alcohol dehydrogenase family)
MIIGHDTLQGKTALVTGGGSGIGKATALLLARAGARVAVLGKTRESVEATVTAMGGAEKGHFCVEADVGDESQMALALRNVAAQWHHLDILVANAGINGVWAPLEKLSVSEWDETLAVNLRGTFLTVREAIPLLRQRGGSVIIVSSINGTRIFSNSGATAYSCSKAGQVAFAKMVALELARDRIRVNVVCPGSIETDINQSTVQRDLESIRVPVEFPDGEVPLTRGAPGQPDQVAQLIWFLASDAASHITGTEIYIEGGQSLLQG